MICYLEFNFSTIGLLAHDAHQVHNEVSAVQNVR